ncbi:high affinity copper uptake protein 1 [Trichuris trichiura]|uniref:Copper transport protein n=1 Tax=Trichuris trichiura TaxID=36087 RepID=A0A077YXD9_TRITR|nr:high affinity copper uptake protein 1 [Trichuris trichiura]
MDHHHSHGHESHINHSEPGDHADHMSMMSMYFHGGYEETILFSFWKTCTLGGFVGSFIGIMLLAVLYEGIKTFRESLFRRSICSASSASVSRQACPSQTDSVTQSGVMSAYKVTYRLKPVSVGHAIQSAMHMLQLLISYLLMLIVMTFNTWLMFAVVIGAGVGYLLFGWRRTLTTEPCEHCH